MAGSSLSSLDASLLNRLAVNPSTTSNAAALNESRQIALALVGSGAFWRSTLEHSTRAELIAAAVSTNSKSLPPCLIEALGEDYESVDPFLLQHGPETLGLVARRVPAWRSPPSRLAELFLSLHTPGTCEDASVFGDESESGQFHIADLVALGNEWLRFLDASGADDDEDAAAETALLDELKRLGYPHRARALVVPNLPPPTTPPRVVLKLSIRGAEEEEEPAPPQPFELGGVQEEEEPSPPTPFEVSPMVTDEAAVATTTLKRSHASTTTPVTDEQEDEDGAKKKQRARLVDAAFNAAEAWSPAFFRGALARAAALF